MAMICTRNIPQRRADAKGNCPNVEKKRKKLSKHDFHSRKCPVYPTPKSLFLVYPPRRGVTLYRFCCVMKVSGFIRLIASRHAKRRGHVRPPGTCSLARGHVVGPGDGDLWVMQMLFNVGG